MKKVLSVISIFCLVISVVHAQGVSEAETFTQVAPATQDAGPVPQLDSTARTTARDIHAKLIEKQAQKITMGQFFYQGSNTPLATYWINQIIGELSNTSNRPYILLSSGVAGADWTISGEIIALPGVIRIYTRLVRASDRAVEASTYSDFERSTALVTMLAASSGGGSSGGSSSSQGTPDEWEPDDWGNPITYEIGESESVTPMDRTIHSGDEDFFLLVVDRDGRLVAETTGNIDTYMYLYNYETEEELGRNDDGGSGSNARIRHTVQAGTTYLAKVRGYSSSTNGAYAFRAYISSREGGSGFQNPISYEIGVGEETQVVNRNLTDGDEGDYFLLVPDRAGLLVMETTGNVDTYMELYNADTRELLDEDDDGGSSSNARIRYTVISGSRYIAMVRGYSGSSTGRYGFKAYFSGQGMLPADEFEPDDEPAQAGSIQIGTPQQHTFHSADDIDWVKFQVTRPGRYVIRVRGVRSTRLDTYIELFDANFNPIAENDDGGEDRDAMLSQRLENGQYSLKVWCLDDEPDQAYTISIQAE